MYRNLHQLAMPVTTPVGHFIRYTLNTGCPVSHPHLVIIKNLEHKTTANLIAYNMFSMTVTLT